MSKLIKRIRKETKNLGNCIVLGDVWGNLPAVAENFQNVFLKITGISPLRAKNIIPRAEFQETAIFSSIDHVFIDENCLDHIKSIEKMLTHFSPVIHIGYGEFLEKTQSSYLKSLSYEIVEIKKDYQRWKRKI